MSFLPGFLVTGIITIILGLVIMVWSALFIQRAHGGLALIALSMVFLLFGGGFFPPLIGIIGGVAGTQINKPMTGKPGVVTRSIGRLGILPLVILLVYLIGQFPVGYFFNDWLMSVMGLGLLLILILLPIAVYAAYAHDAIPRANL